MLGLPSLKTTPEPSRHDDGRALKPLMTKEIKKVIDVWCLISLMLFPLIFAWGLHPFFKNIKLDRAFCVFFLSIDVIGVGFSVWWGCYKICQTAKGRKLMNFLFFNPDGTQSIKKAVLWIFSIDFLVLVFSQAYLFLTKK